MRAGVEFAIDSPYPAPDEALRHVYAERGAEMSRQLPYIAAINEAISQEMARDESVLYFGQNIATTEEDEFLKAFGSDRVRVTPISETAEIGMAIGAALAGYRPVVELYMAEFMLVAMDQVVNEAPRFRYMSGGRVKVPLVLKAGYGFTAGWAGQHTGSIYGMFTGVPGLKVALPATPADAKGLMATAIRDDNPVCFFHHYLLTLELGEVPEGEYLVPFGQADVRRAGDDVTIVASGAMVGKALAAADALAASGVGAEVIDPRTLVPLDVATILDSVRKTGRLVLVDQATRHASASAIIAAEIAEQGFEYLKAPLKQVTALDATVPYSKPMEDYILPDEEKIAEAVRQVTAVNALASCEPALAVPAARRGQHDVPLRRPAQLCASTRRLGSRRCHAKRQRGGRTMSMRAVGFTEFGGPDVLHIVSLPVPSPGPGEVRVRVAAAAVNPTDLAFRSGAHRSMPAGVEPPYVPGMDLAGLVDVVGEEMTGVGARPAPRTGGLPATG